MLVFIYLDLLYCAFCSKIRECLLLVTYLTVVTKYLTKTV